MNVTINNPPKHNVYRKYNYNKTEQQRIIISNNPKVQSENILANYNKANINFKGFPPTRRILEQLVWQDNPELFNVIEFVNKKMFPFFFENNKAVAKEDLKFMHDCFNYFWSEKNLIDKSSGTYSIFTYGSMETFSKKGQKISDAAQHVLLTLEFNLNKSSDMNEQNSKFAKRLLDSCKTIMALKKEGKNKEINNLIKLMKEKDPIYKICQDRYFRY